MKIAFWSNVRGHSGVTSNLACISVLSALSCPNERTIVFENHKNIVNLGSTYYHPQSAGCVREPMYYQTASGLEKVLQLVEKVEELLTSKTEKDKLAFVGDGINDAPVLSRADIGIAMGALGSDAAIEAADIVLMDDDPLKIVKAIRISKKCMRIVYENIYFAIGIKILCLILGALGIANMWLAIFADVGVMVIAVLNAIRVLFVKKL